MFFFQPPGSHKKNMQEEKCPSLPKFPEYPSQEVFFGAPKGLLLRRCQTGFIHTDPHKVFFKTTVILVGSYVIFVMV